RQRLSTVPTMLMGWDFLRMPSSCDQSEFIQRRGRSRSLRNAGKQESQTELTGLLYPQSYFLYSFATLQSRSPLPLQVMPVRLGPVHLVIPISSIPGFLSCSSVRLIPLVRNDIVPFVGRGTGDKGDDGLGITHVEDFMRHVRLDVNEIAGFVLQYLLKPPSEFVAHSSFDDIKDQLEADMNVG